MRPIARRTAALVAVPALALVGLVSISAPATAAADPGPADAAADWLVTQLDDGVIHYDDGDLQFDDLGVTVDVGFALAAHGGNPDVVDEIVDVAAERAYAEWYTYTDNGVTTQYSGSVAKLAAFAQAAGADETDFGGHDLIEMLENAVSVAPPTTGRLQNLNDAYGDTNMFGQAYALQALSAADSPAAAPVLTYLLGQQCSEGWFRLDFSAADAVDQTCDGDPNAEPDTDATAMALSAMMSLHDDALVPAIDQAEAWLLDTQYDDGSWDGRQNSPESNANSTGIVGAVLHALGDTEAAEAGAAWLRAHQLTNIGACSPYQAADLGAIAWNDARRSDLEDGIDKPTRYEAQKATAGSLALLAIAPAAGETHVLSAPGYVRAGARASVGVIGAAPGEALCAAVIGHQGGTLGWADRNGEADLAVRIPNQEGPTSVDVSNAAGLIDSVELSALGKAKLEVSLKKQRIAAGARQVVTVRGLAPGEMATIGIRWPAKAGSGSAGGSSTQANAKGVVKVSFKVPNRPGSAKVKVKGEFNNRKGVTSFTITR